MEDVIKTKARVRDSSGKPGAQILHLGEDLQRIARAAGNAQIEIKS